MVYSTIELAFVSENVTFDVFTQMRTLVQNVLGSLEVSILTILFCFDQLVRFIFKVYLE